MNYQSVITTNNRHTEKAKKALKSDTIKKILGRQKILRLGKFQTRFSKENEILVRVHSASIKDWDWGLVRGKPFVIRLFFGLRKPKINIPGVDISGSIEAVGDNVSSFKIGDEIYCDLSECGLGGFAEYVCVPEKTLYCKPSTISHNEAAAIPHASILALQGFVDYGKVKAGQSILINGTGGEVGTLGIQFLKQYDVKVTGVDSAEKLDSMQNQTDPYLHMHELLKRVKGILL